MLNGSTNIPSIFLSLRHADAKLAHSRLPNMRLIANFVFDKCMKIMTLNGIFKIPEPFLSS